MRQTSLQLPMQMIHGIQAREKQRSKKKIANGPKKLMGMTWQPDLSNKIASIKTHTYYAMKKCQGSPEKLRELLDNIVEQYKSKHEGSSAKSRCKTDPNYESSKQKIKDSDAERILRIEIKNSKSTNL